MRIISFVILISFFCFCNSQKKAVKINSNSRTYEIPKLNYSLIYHKIIKIDSLNNFYIISTKKDDKFYKIISSFDSSKQIYGKRILLNGIYNFKLNSILGKLEFGHGIVTKEMEKYNDTSIVKSEELIRYYGMFIVLEKGYVNNLFRAKYLNGLYYY